MMGSKPLLWPPWSWDQSWVTRFLFYSQGFPALGRDLPKVIQPHRSQGPKPDCLLFQLASIKPWCIP